MESLIFYLVAITASLFALLLIVRPQNVFEIQRRFYLLINWRIEPVSFEKEIRNTRIMGAFLLIVIVAAGIYCWTR